MKKTILITGATDGIGLETAKMLSDAGHNLLLHGRNPSKLERVVNTLSSTTNVGTIESYLTDLSKMEEVTALADAVFKKHSHLDVLINNAGVLKTNQPFTEDGLDVRFAVNTLAPYLLTARLLPLIPVSGRIINLSSAAQSPVNLEALKGQVNLHDMDAYAQSKLALTMWSRHQARTLPDGPVIVAVNPGSLLGSKMVKEGFGIEGKDLGIGADILIRAALSDEFANAFGQYYDNDKKRFAHPHPDAMDDQKNEAVVNTIVNILGGRHLG